MKITRKKVSASEAIAVVAPEAMLVDADPTQVLVGECPIGTAIDFIQSAISSLTSVAKENEVARDSIANLAVVMMDLQSLKN